MSRREMNQLAPAWSRWLLQRVAPEERADDIVGDLEEAHRARLVRRGPLLAHVLTGIESIELASAVLRERARRRWKRQGTRTVGLSLLDFKLGVRMLAKSPGLSLVSVIGMS